MLRDGLSRIVELNEIIPSGLTVNRNTAQIDTCQKNYIDLHSKADSA